MLSSGGEFWDESKHSNMDKDMKRHFEAFQREVRFAGEHPLTPPNARADALVVILNSVIANMQGAVSSQVLGRGEFLGGTGGRRLLAKELRGAVREGKVLPLFEHPVDEDEDGLELEDGHDGPD